jgi:hypothetical protein
MRQQCVAGEVLICYKGSMNRTVTRIGHLSDQENDAFVPGPASSRLALVWPLTRQAASLSKKHDAERRLQRDVAVLSRRAR